MNAPSNTVEEPRILHVLPDFLMGGTQSLVIALAEGLEEYGYRSSVVGLLGDGPMLDRAHRRNVAATAMKSGSASEEFHTLGWLRPVSLARTLGLLVRVKPDVLHCHLYSASLLARTASLLQHAPWVDRRRPVIVESLHNMYEWKSFEPAALVTDRLLMRWTDRIISPSYAVNEFSRIQLGVPVTKQRVIHHGINTARFAPAMQRGQDFRSTMRIPSEHLVVTSVGRMISKKRLDVFLEAAAGLPTNFRGREVTFVVVGDGPDEASLRSLARTFGIDRRVRWIAESEDMAGLFNASDLIVQTADREGFGLAMAEAMACGRPCISTRNGPAEEIIVHGTSGVLHKRGDISGLRSSIQGLLADDEQRRRLGEEGRMRIVAHFNEKRMLDRYDGMYREILTERAWRGK